MDLPQVKLSIDQVKKLVEGLAKRINAPSNLLPTYEHIRGDATPNIEIDLSGSYNLVISERGREYQRRKTRDISELMYWIFEHITFSMAADYELKNRIEHQDTRIIMFKKQEELLGIFSEEWKQKEIVRHEKYLNAPSIDIDALTGHMKQLTDNGMDQFDAMEASWKKFSPRFE